MLLLSTALGCTPAPSDPTRSPTPADRTAAAQQLLDQLQTTAVHHDRAAFDRAISPRDPAFGERASVWFANLQTLGERIRLRATTSQAVPGAGVRTRFDDRAWLQQVIVAWRPVGSSRAAEATVWLTLVADGDRVLFGGDTDAPVADRRAPRPLWLQSVVTVRQRSAVTVLGAEGVSLQPWLNRAEAAAAAVRAALRTWPGPRWNGELVVEVPATAASFERSIGVPAGSYARIGAVAWPRGTRAADAAVQVVVNPEVTGPLSGEGIAVLLTHEVVHVATRSFASAAPTWLVEGLADHVAYEARPATRSAALRPLREAVRRGWGPTGLPPESAFAASARDLDLAYAQAWSLCDLLADRYGDAALLRLYAQVSAGTPLADGLRALGTSEADLVHDWRAELDRLRG